MKRAAGDAPLSWTKDDQLHFTLAFLGEQPEDAVPRLREAAAPCAALPAFDLTLSGAGSFPDARRPRVLWVGAEQGARELEDLAACLAGGLRSAGFVLEKRPFHPQLTATRGRPGGVPAAPRAPPSAPNGERALLPADRTSPLQNQ